MFRGNRDFVYSVWETLVEHWKRREWSITFKRFFFLFDFQFGIQLFTTDAVTATTMSFLSLKNCGSILFLVYVLFSFVSKSLSQSTQTLLSMPPSPPTPKTNNKLQLITEPFYLASSYLAIIEWSWVGYEKFCKSRRVLFTEADCFIIHLKLFQV